MNEENRRIAKNTLILYGRMILNIAIGIFTGRVILDALGESDYGLYCVVAGFVSLFHVVSSPLSGAISRFVVYSLGKGDLQKAKDIFGTSVLVMISISILIIFLAETIGVWFINNRMVIPAERLGAANWVFQIALVDMVYNITMAPYFASFVSHEAFALDSILALSVSFARLGICFLIMFANADKLILYTALLLTVTIIQRSVYKYYARRHFEETHYKLKFHKTLFKELLSFAGWTYIGNTAHLVQKQGGNILLNLFGGTLVNAAAGVAGTINGVIQGFVGNFTASFSPQLTKSYAAGRFDRTTELIIHGTKISFYMILLPAIPIFLNIDWILDIWLVKVPKYSDVFIRIGLMSMMFSFLSQQVSLAITATGDIKYFQIWSGLVTIMAVPLSYILLKLGMSVLVVYYTNLFVDFILLFVKTYLLKGKINGFSIRLFVNKVVINSFVTTVIASILPTLLWLWMADGFVRVATTCVVSVVSTMLAIYYVGCNQSERESMKNKLAAVKKKIGVGNGVNKL